MTWRVFGVIQGVEGEELFELDGAGTCLVEAGHRVNRTGAVSGFAPPGDIHRVRNAGDITATSIHIYGTDALALIRCEALEYAPESGSRTVAPRGRGPWIGRPEDGSRHRHRHVTSLRGGDP